MKQPPTDHGTRLTGFALRNAVPMNILFVILVVVGAIVIRKMPVDVYPDVVLGEVTLDTIWLGASAEDVERLITDRIEDKIQDNPGILWIVSDSKPDASLIRVKFREDLSPSGLDAAIRVLRADVDQVDDLPEDAREPVLKKLSIDEVFFLLWVTVVDEGDVGEEVLHSVALRLKRMLRGIHGVGKVDDVLVRDREVHIKADRDAMRKHGLTLRDIADLP
ncbi:MAG: efflux RND transporter permease subunit [Planctomycetota bacterium]|jgi:multidrug efflux pump subunit AcrB